MLADESSEGLAKTDEEISEVLGMSVSGIEKLRKRFVLEGFSASLEDRKRDRVYERKLDGEKEVQLIQLACSESPDGSNNWTLSLLSDKLVELKVVDSISNSTVGCTLKKTN